MVDHAAAMHARRITDRIAHHLVSHRSGSIGHCLGPVGLRGRGQKLAFGNPAIRRQAGGAEDAVGVADGEIRKRNDQRIPALARGDTRFGHRRGFQGVRVPALATAGQRDPARSLRRGADCTGDKAEENQSSQSARVFPIHRHLFRSNQRVIRLQIASKLEI